MPKIDTSSVPSRKGTGYPSPFDEPCAARTRRHLGNAGGLRDFGVNLMTLPPAGWSGQRPRRFAQVIDYEPTESRSNRR
jgi:uncharacterized cupin superfamily protein